VKKILTFFLAISYLAISTGVAISTHYCMGRVSSVTFFRYSDKCGKCGMTTTGGCCKDELRIFKLVDSHKIISNNINLNSPVSFFNNSYKNFDSDLRFSTDHVISNNNSPPPDSQLSLGILNCVSRF